MRLRSCNPRRLYHFSTMLRLGLFLVSVTTSCAALATEVAPYFYAWSFGDNTYKANSLLEVQHHGSVDAVTIAFITSGGGCTLDANTLETLMTNVEVISDVTAFLQHGGRVSLSFGGEAGIYLEAVCSASQLSKLISKVMDKYQIYALDFDIEGSQLANTALNRTRNSALKLLQQRYPKLYVSFTLPVDKGVGLTSDAIALLTSALRAGVKVSLVNIMAMDYGSVCPDMGKQAVLAATATFNQLHPIFIGRSAAQLWAMLGITPMIGQNDSAGEIFNQSDAKIVANFAKQHGLGLLSYWALQRDQVGVGKNLDTYSNINKHNYEFYKIMRSGIAKPVTAQ